MFRPFMSELRYRLRQLIAPEGHRLLCYEINEAAGMIHIHLMTEDEIVRWQTANRPAPTLSVTIATGQAAVYPADAAANAHARLLAQIIAE